MQDVYSSSEFEALFMQIYKDEIEERVIYYKNLMIQEEQEKQAEAKRREEFELQAEKEKIKEQIRQKELKRKARELAMNELKEEGIISTSKKREPIPQRIRDEVWNRDGGKCVQCGSNENLEFDHIIPFSKGGSNAKRNLQLLCQKCNREKSNKIGV